MGIVRYALESATFAGPVNACSPNPVRNADYVAACARALGRAPGLPVPAFMLRAALGEMADALVLASRRMEPHRLVAAGYEFRHPDLEEALRHELSVAGPVRQ